MTLFKLKISGNNRKRKIAVILSSCQWAALSWWAESEEKLLPVTISWLYQRERRGEAVLGHSDDLHPWVGDFPGSTRGTRRSGLPSPAPAPACDAQGISTEQEGKTLSWLWSDPLRVLSPLTGPEPSECEGAGPNSPPSPQRHPESMWLSQRPQGREETKSSQKPKANFLLALGPRGVPYSFLEIKLYFLLPIDSSGIHLNDLNFISPPET